MPIHSTFERLLWNSRVIVVVAVIASLVVSTATFYVATVDVIDLVLHLRGYADFGIAAEVRAAARTTFVTHVVEIVDGYLLGAIMFIFALGLYELFVSRIEAAEGEFATRLLLIQSLDDLKDRLAKVVLLILVVRFFEYALRLEVSTALELLYFGLGVALVAWAVVQGGKKEAARP